MDWNGKINFQRPITINGKPHGIEPLDALPAWQSSDAGRVIYEESTGKLWVGTNSAWDELTPGGVGDHDHDDRYYTETEVDEFFEGEAGGKKQITYSNVLNKPDAFQPINHDNSYHSEQYAISSEISFETLLNNGDVGTGANQLAIGSHNHDTRYADINHNHQADEILFSPASSGLGSNNVDLAIKELKTLNDQLEDQLIDQSDVSIISKYVVGPDTDYTTIQSAINQAVTDGHGPSNPTNVLVKPGNYNENVTIYSGITLSSIISEKTYTTEITGSITYSSSFSNATHANIVGIDINGNSSEDCIVFSGVNPQRLNLFNCEVNAAGSNICLNIQNTNLNSSVVAHNVNFNNNTGANSCIVVNNGVKLSLNNCRLMGSPDENSLILNNSSTLESFLTVSTGGFEFNGSSSGTSRQLLFITNNPAIYFNSSSSYQIDKPLLQGTTEIASGLNPQNVINTSLQSADDVSFNNDGSIINPGNTVQEAIQKLELYTTEALDTIFEDVIYGFSSTNYDIINTYFNNNLNSAIQDTEVSIQIDDCAKNIYIKSKKYDENVNLYPRANLIAEGPGVEFSGKLTLNSTIGGHTTIIDGIDFKGNSSQDDYIIEVLGTSQQTLVIKNCTFTQSSFNGSELIFIDNPNARVILENCTLDNTSPANPAIRVEHGAVSLIRSKLTTVEMDAVEAIVAAGYDVTIESSKIYGQLYVDMDSTLEISNSEVYSGTRPAIYQNSKNLITLKDVLIRSSSDPVIDGVFQTSGYAEFGLKNVTSLTHSGLDGNQEYSLNVNIDGAGNQEYTITTPADTPATSGYQQLSTSYGIFPNDLAPITAGSYNFSVSFDGDADQPVSILIQDSFPARVEGTNDLSSGFDWNNRNKSFIVDGNQIDMTENTTSITNLVSAINSNLSAATTAVEAIEDGNSFFFQATSPGLAGFELQPGATNDMLSEFGISAGTFSGTDATSGYGVMGLTIPSSTDPTPLSTLTPYYLNLSVDGTDSEISISLSTNSYDDLITELNNVTTGATWSIQSSDIRCESDSTGNASSISFSPGTSGTDLLNELSANPSYTAGSDATAARSSNSTNLSSGFDFTDYSESFFLNGVEIVLDQTTSDAGQVVSLISNKLALASQSLDVTESSGLIVFESVNTGSSEEFTILSGTGALSTLGMPEGTYNGVDETSRLWQDVISEVNGQISGGTLTIVSGIDQLRFVSATTGSSSSASYSEGTSDFASAFSASPNTRVNGSDSVSNTEWSNIIPLLNSEVTGAIFSITGGDIRCTSDSSGETSSIEISAGSSNDLLAAVGAVMDPPIKGMQSGEIAYSSFYINPDPVGNVFESSLQTRPFYKVV